VIQSTFTWHAGPRRERQVTTIAIDGTRVSNAALARVNDALRRHETDPQLSPQCHQSRVRIHLYGRDGDRVGRSDYVDLD
jgi:hypothetical protein